MDEEAYFQSQLDQQEQALDAVIDSVRNAVLALPLDDKLGLIGEIHNHQFMIVTFDMRKYIIKIEET